MSAELEPTHCISPQMQAKFVEAKQWYDEVTELEETIRRCGGIAQRNDEDRAVLECQGAALLVDIVELLDTAWGIQT